MGGFKNLRNVMVFIK